MQHFNVTPGSHLAARCYRTHVSGRGWQRSTCSFYSRFNQRLWPSDTSWCHQMGSNTLCWRACSSDPAHLYTSGLPFMPPSQSCVSLITAQYPQCRVQLALTTRTALETLCTLWHGLCILDFSSHGPPHNLFPKGQLVPWGWSFSPPWTDNHLRPKACLDQQVSPHLPSLCLVEDAGSGSLCCG